MRPLILQMSYVFYGATYTSDLSFCLWGHLYFRSEFFLLMGPPMPDLSYVFLWATYTFRSEFVCLWSLLYLQIRVCVCLMVGLTLVLSSEGFSCELISLLCYHCLLEAFSLGLFAFMTLVYFCFIGVLLYMENLSHSSFDRDQTLEV
jgi:hypothetical protein